MRGKNGQIRKEGLLTVPTPVKNTIANFGARGFYDLKYQDIGFMK